MNDEASEDASIQPAVLDAVCDALTVAFIVYDKNDLIVFASRQVLNYLPVSKHYLQPGVRLRDFLGAVYDSGIRHAYGSNGAGVPMSREDWLSQRIASHWRERWELVERLGPDRWLRSMKRRLPNGFGVCILSDISEHKKREEQWRADMERVQLTEEILDNLAYPIFVKDRNLNYVAVNKAFCAMRGCSPDVMLGRSVGDLMAPEIANRFNAEDREVMETGEPMAIIEKAVRTDDRVTAVITRKQRIGKPGRYFLVTSIADVSDIDIEPMNEPITAAQIVSREIVSHRPDGVVGHDVLAGFRENAVKESYPRDHFLGMKVLLVTADAEIEALGLKSLASLGFEACAIRSIGEEEAFLDVAASANVRIDLVVVDNQMEFRCLELARTYGIDVIALDARQIRTEFAYLVVKHFNYRDDRNLKASTSNEDWEISTSDPSVKASLLQVLVAEDNPINQIVFSQILEGLGYSYKIAVDGGEAVRMWEEYKPAIVLMDVTLPVMNGFDAVRHIRNIEADRPFKTPIIGVLAQAFEHDRLECLAAGMSDIMLKPVSPDIVEAAFEKFLGDQTKISAS